jgi:hypothetical protein
MNLAGVRRRNSLGAAEWSTVEGSPHAFPVASHLLASIQGLDRSWPGRVSRLSWPHRLAGRNGRWHIFLREKRGLCVRKSKRGKGTKTMVLVDGHGLPLGAEIASASPHEVMLIEPLLNRRLLPIKPKRLIYDLAAECDPLRTRLTKRRIELVCPHRENRKKPSTQDGRKLRRYRRRRKIERSIGWL